MIQRSFRDLTGEEIANIEKASFTWEHWGATIGWSELLRSQRILIVSEAGVGKTFECQAQQQRLWNAGKPAFFLDLATLANSSVRDMLSIEEEMRLDEWLRSQSALATFFLDSIDELKLTLGKFDQALKRLNKSVAGQLGRMQVIITTRPVPVDRDLIAQYLPIPDTAKAEPTAEAFADAIMDRKKKPDDTSTKAKAWRSVGLMPLTTAQMRQFAVAQNVTDADALLSDIQVRDAEEFAQRPQDLIELCSDWREHHRIRTHQQQVETNITIKLKPSAERNERAPLAQDKAIEAASRLALAAILTRKLTLRYNAETDTIEASEFPLDVSKILPDLNADETATLLERPLFGFASYGRVRFHHRSVVEYLAAKRLEALLRRGISIKAIKRLLFTATAQGTRVVRPSMRPVAAWLALTHDTVFDEIVALDPAVILDHGDPQSYAAPQRLAALEAYVRRYGSGGWRGLSTPQIQVHRFASPELGNAVNRLFRSGIENPEVRHLLLRMIGAGKITVCADLAHDVAMDPQRPSHERELAIDALLQLFDSRLGGLAQSLEADTARWPNDIARAVMLDLFPSYLPISRLQKLLGRLNENSRTIGDLNYRFPQRIESIALSPVYLDQLRQALFDLLIHGATWEQDKFPHLRTTRPHLMAAHLAASRRQCVEGVRSDGWIASALLAIRLSKDEYDRQGAVTDLRIALDALSPNAREDAFWAEENFLARLRQPKDAWNRVIDLFQNCGIQLNAEKDGAWVQRRLSNPNEPIDQREMMLWIELNLFRRDLPDYRSFIESLKTSVADAPSLAAIIDNRLKPQEGSAELQKMQAQHERRRKQADREAEKAHASWVTFWTEIVQTPSLVFASDRAENTAWNLWQAVERSGDESRASGWNRRFIEAQFGSKIANHLRETMMAMWRKDKPTLRSERPENEKNRFLVKWQFGLAAISAEAEDPNWAKRLSEEEAELACRYAPLELNGFPSWLESLAIEHPRAVDRVLGEQLTFSLRESGENSHSMFLQNASHASAIVAALFIPRIREWLQSLIRVDAAPNSLASEQNLQRAIDIIIKAGNDEDRRFIEAAATKRLSDGLSVPLVHVWLPALFRLRPAAGVTVLEVGLKQSTASTIGAGVQLFGKLFDRDRIGVDLRALEFSPPLLFRLARLAYQHVRIVDDVHHTGVHSLGEREYAERARDAVTSALLAKTGADGWAAKLEMANDPLFAHFKDRIIAVAEERAAEEADNAAFTEAQFSILDRSGEAPPSTTEAMFSLMRDRLDDIDDLLLQDESPREAWAIIADEHVMRRAIARELRNAAKDTYIVVQESVTADEKETDIRLKSTSSNQIGTIELKLADRRPGSDLFNTIKDQLLTKYMAAAECRAGCLLVTIARNRQWDHPKTGTKISFEQLMVVLNDEAERLSKELGREVKLMAKGLDLRPRLETERLSRSKDR
jgi:ferredoxin-like protein FixX